MPESRFRKHIHLLYVPTLSCNLGCRYCYLGSQTDSAALRVDSARAAPVLDHAINAFLDAGVLPFNVSLHGGEPTMLPPDILDELFSMIRGHYLRHFDELTARGYRKSAPHIKTNLFNFHKLYDLFDLHKVSVSASLDLPLRMHGALRTTRQGKSWLKQTLKNLGLLASYPHSRKISSTIYMEHLDDIEEIVEDIISINDDIGFDMNSFNIMFGFESALNRERFGTVVHGATQEKQIELYETLKSRFKGTGLEEGFRRNWFDEFKPSYCTNAFNCGERFFLLQSDGSVWSCVRGQGLEQCYYGNILTDPVQQILDSGQRRIAILHQQSGLDEQCVGCSHIHICHTGCPVVKMQCGSSRSYTCALQKAIYHDNPVTYPPAADPDEQKSLAGQYALGMHPASVFAGSISLKPPSGKAGISLPVDINQQKNFLSGLIDSDPILQQLYSEDSFFVEINGEAAPLFPQITKAGRLFYFIAQDDPVYIHVRRSLFSVNCHETVRNTLYIQMLRDTQVIYGDEQRSKQEHLFTHQIFYNLLESSPLMGADYVVADISVLLRMHSRHFFGGVLNNLFVTTSALREYHYQKQKSNAFYHIQAINLPFQNIEFYWVEG